MGVTIVLALIALVFIGAVVTAFVSHDTKIGAGLTAIVSFLAFLGLLIPSTIYQQDPGEAVVLRSASGAVVGQTVEEGWHTKAPWVKAIGFDVRNNVVSYVGKGGDDHSGGKATGPQITFQDKDGVTGNADVVVTYSLVGDAVETIYEDYRTQESFVTKVITNDVRSAVRNVPGAFSTMDVLVKRADVEAGIRAALEERWADKGVVIESVALQEIRYSEEVNNRLDEAQAARIAVDKAKADQEKVAVEAETELIRQQGIADANAVLTESLTPEVLQQKYIDALREAGAVYVVPEGSTPLVQVPTK